MVDLTNNSILLENEANLATPVSALNDLLTYVQSKIPSFYKAKLFGTDINAQIHLVCICTIGTNMGVLYVNQLTRTNIDIKIAEAVGRVFNQCKNKHPEGYSI